MPEPPRTTSRPPDILGAVLVHRWDAPIDDDEWRTFAVAQGFGHLIAAGHNRDVPVVVPTQFILDSDSILLHLARPNPIWAAIDENPLVLLSIAGDWSYIPSAWKAIGDEDPMMGIPTTYYGAAQLTARAEIIDEPAEVATVLRAQLSSLQPDVEVTDPLAHGTKLGQIRGLRLDIIEVRAKFKYGGNVDGDHRAAIAERLETRDGPGDQAARAHVMRRSD